MLLSSYPQGIVLAHPDDAPRAVIEIPCLARAPQCVAGRHRVRATWREVTCPKRPTGRIWLLD